MFLPQKYFITEVVFFWKLQLFSQSVIYFTGGTIQVIWLSLFLFIRIWFWKWSSKSVAFYKLILLFIWWVYTSALNWTDALSSWQNKAKSDCCTWRYTVNPLTSEVNSTAHRCLTRFFTGDFTTWTVHFVNICVKNQQIDQLFIQFIYYVWGVLCLVTWCVAISNRTTSLETARPYTILYRLLLNWASIRRH
jgi:hypothetical protein